MESNFSLHLPDLSKLFAGNATIISWYDVPVQELSSSQCSEYLVNRWTARISATTSAQPSILQSQETPSFPAPNDGSKKRVESLTAPVNVPPSTDKHYDIAQIKQDAAWLSKELAVNEEQALRVVLLEWQNSPVLKLHAGYSDVEIASLKDVYASQLAFDADFEAAAFRSRDDTHFANESSRRLRQIVIHFKECIGFARTWLAFRDPDISNKLQTNVPNQPPTLTAIVDLAVSQVELFTSELEGKDYDEETMSMCQTGRLYYLAEILQTIFLASEKTQSVTADTVKKWIACMADVQFLRTIEPSPSLPQDELRRLGSLTTLASIAILQPAKTIDDLETSWLADTATVSEVQQILLNAVDEACIPAVPVAFAWSLILQDVRTKGISAKERRDSPTLNRILDSSSWDSATGRRASMTSSTQQSIYEDIIDAALAVSGLPDPITTIVQHTIEQFNVPELIAAMLRTSHGTPFIQRIKCQTVQELVVVALNTLPDAYGPVILEPQFAILEPDSIDAEACNNFLLQPDLLEGIFDNAAARFPHETYPFIKLCRLLACADGSGTFNGDGDQYITFRLNSMKSFTRLAIGTFQNYHTIHEDENANLVELNDHTYAFPQGVGLISQGEDSSNALVLPANTEGEVISNSEPPVVKWKFEYSALQLIGEWLELYYNGVLHEVISPYEDSPAIASEMILLITNLLTTTQASEFSNQDAVISLLERLGSRLNFNPSIIDLIFNILEQDIQAFKRKPTNMSFSSILYATLSFARAILKIQPSSFWRNVIKTSLAGGNGLLSAIVLSIDSVSADTKVALTVSDLFSDMVAACLQRPLGLVKSTLHKNDERLYENVMFGLTQGMLEIYDAAGQWGYIGRQKHRHITKLNRSFTSILYLVHGIGSDSSLTTACLRSSAQLIMDHLRPESVDDAKSGPILNYMLDYIQLRQPFLAGDDYDMCLSSHLEVSKTLIDTAQTQSILPSGFEKCLLDLAPILVRNIYLDHSSKSHDNLVKSHPAVQLIRTLVTSLTPTKSTSLLGYLGSASAIEMINILSTSPPNNDFALEAWALLSSLINLDQQWLSIVLLTGSLPDQKDIRNSNNDDPATGIVYRGKLIVDKGLDLLSRAESMDKHLIQAVLQFMIVAQQNWPWTLNTLRSRADIFPSLIRFATNRPGASSEHYSTHSLINAFVTDFCSVFLQYAKSTRDQKLADTVAPLVEWLAMNAISVKSYNASQHNNLSRNFEMKFGMPLNDFRRRARSSSNNNYYDIHIIDTVLYNNPTWNVSKPNAQTYEIEVKTANTNLTNVDSELILLRSFQSLLLEHASYFAELDSVKNTLAPIARRCIEANNETNLKMITHLQLFDNVLQSRAETALNLLQQMLRVRITGSEVRELFKLAWESCLLENASYEKAVVNNDLTYWRTSLNVVLLALQSHLGKSKVPFRPLASVSGQTQQSAAADLLKNTTNVHTQVVEVGKVVIGQGLDTVVSIVLEAKQEELQKPPSMRKDAESSTTTVGLSDLRLILNFLTSILRHPRLPEFRAQLAQALIETGAIQSALRLYSVSHLLAGQETGNDPIHAELALRLLVSLSSLSECAEELAIEGILSQLLTARVTIALQKMPDGVGNLDTRQHCASLYAVWSQGILPLVLNLLNAVGAPIASEVSTFINTFPEQLRRLAIALRPRQDSQGFLTLALAKEVSTMSLLSYILTDYKAAGASAAVDPTLILPLHGFDEQRVGLLSDLKENLALDKAVLARKIVPTTASEESMGAARLTELVKVEIQGAIACLTNGEEEG